LCRGFDCKTLLRERTAGGEHQRDRARRQRFGRCPRHRFFELGDRAFEVVFIRQLVRDRLVRFRDAHRYFGERGVAVFRGERGSQLGFENAVVAKRIARSRFQHREVRARLDHACVVRAARSKQRGESLARTADFAGEQVCTRGLAEEIETFGALRAVGCEALGFCATNDRVLRLSRIERAWSVFAAKGSE
jgi:hypothetical protein